MKLKRTRLSGLLRRALFATSASAALFFGPWLATVHAGTFGTGGRASDIALDEPRGSLYIANFTANRVDIMSLADNKLKGSFQVSQQPSSLSVSPDGNYLVIALADPPHVVSVSGDGSYYTAGWGPVRSLRHSYRAIRGPSRHVECRQSRNQLLSRANPRPNTRRKRRNLKPPRLLFPPHHRRHKAASWRRLASPSWMRTIWLFGKSCQGGDGFNGRSPSTSVAPLRCCCLRGRIHGAGMGTARHGQLRLLPQPGGLEPAWITHRRLSPCLESATSFSG